MPPSQDGALIEIWWAPPGSRTDARCYGAVYLDTRRWEEQPDWLKKRLRVRGTVIIAFDLGVALVESGDWQPGDLTDPAHAASLLMHQAIAQTEPAEFPSLPLLYAPELLAGFHLAPEGLRSRIFMRAGESPAGWEMSPLTPLGEEPPAGVTVERISRRAPFPHRGRQGGALIGRQGSAITVRAVASPRFPAIRPLPTVVAAPPLSLPLDPTLQARLEALREQWQRGPDSDRWG